MIMEDKEYTQVCVAPGMVVGNDGHESFEKFMLAMFQIRIKYIEEIKTNPDIDESGQDVPETGNRNDIFFRIHSDDVLKFSLDRLEHGIRWIEDIFFNHQEHLYPSRIKEYMSWDPFAEEKYG